MLRLGIPRAGKSASARVGESEEETFDSGASVGASEADPSGTRVGAFDGGGKSEGDDPVALEGVRTAGPPSACVGEGPPRNRPCSPMGSCYGLRANGILAPRGNLGG